MIVAPVCLSLPGDTLGAPQVIEMRMADDDEVAPVNVVGDQASACRPFGPVDVGVEKYDEIANGEAERSTAVPVKDRPHLGQVTRSPDPSGIGTSC